MKEDQIHLPPMTMSRKLALAAAYLVAHALLFKWVPLFWGPEGESWFPSPWFPPAGLGLAMLLVLGVRYWPLIFVARAIPLIYSKVEGLPDAGIMVAAATGYTVAALLIERVFRVRPERGTTRDVFVFLLSTAFGSMLTGLIATAALWNAGILNANAFARSAMTWWTGDWIGMLTLTPLLCWIMRGPGAWTRRLSREVGGRAVATPLAGVMVLSVAVLVVVFGGFLEIGLRLHFLLLAPVIAFAVALGYSGAMMGAAFLNIASFIAIGAIRYPLDSLTDLQFLLLSQAVTGLLLGSAIKSRQDVEDQLRLERTALAEEVANRTAELREANEALSHHLGELSLSREQLGLSEQRNRAIVDAVPDLIMRQRRDGTFLEIIVAASDDLTRPPEELIGRRPTETGIPASVVAESLSVIGSVLDSGRLQTWEYELDVAKGVQAYEARVVPCGPDEVISFIRNVTDRRESERRLKDALEQANAAAAAKARFLALVSHELRTPLTAINGLSELLVDTRLDPEQRSQLVLIRDSGQNLLEIINQILDFSRIEAGKATVAQSPFLLDDLLETVCGLVGAMAHRKGIGFVCLPPRSCSVVVAGDEGKLRQILLNLLGNAVKFTEAGGVTLRVSVGEGDAPSLEFVVSDTGEGIPAEFRERLFEPFAQADSPETRRVGGTGLGLAITLQFVELLGGRIDFDSDPGVGTTFRVSVPVRFADHPASTAPDPQTAGRVVVLRAEETARELWEILAAGLGCTARFATTMSEVRAMVREAQDGSGTVVVLGKADFRSAPLDEVMEVAHAARAGGGCVLLACPPDEPDAPLPPGIAIVRQPLLHTRIHRVIAHARHLGNSRDLGTASTPSARSGERRVRILLVEDTETIRLVMIRMLERGGFGTPDVAVDGDQAMTMATAVDYDVILMDRHLPGIDGCEVSRRMRATLAARRPPIIIALTAAAFESDREECLAAGMDDFLSKPVRPKDLDAVIARHLDHRGDSQQPSGG